MNDINVVYAVNRARVDAILLSTLSLVMHNKDRNINVYILTMDFSSYKSVYSPVLEEDRAIVEKVLRQYNTNTNVYLLDKEKPILENRELLIKLDSSYTPYTLLRLFIGKIDSLPSKVLYLDSDIMINGSLDDLFSLNMGDKFIGAVLDVMGRYFIGKDYFNAGVLLIDLAAAKKTSFFDDVLSLVKRKKYYFYDQTVLNKIAKKIGATYYLPRKYNEQRNVKSDTVIKHFCQGIKLIPFFHVYNIKQWEIEKVHNKLNIHCFDDIYKEYEKVKDAISSESKYVLQIDHLVKTYGNVNAVNDISFKVKKGSLFAFLGINGAGKSTTINIICSILQKNSGKVNVCGYDLDNDKDLPKIKEEIGIVFQNSVLDNDLTVLENLKIRTSFYSMNKDQVSKKLDRIIELLDLKPILKRQVKKLSGGQKRRVDIARAMIHEPKLLILDEPTTGLDPKTRQNVWKLIDEIREKTGMTVFLTTHYLEEADQATFVVIMDKGNIIARGTPNELKNKYSSDYILAFLKRNKEFDNKLNNDSVKFIYDLDKKAYKIYVKDSLKGKEIINKYSDYIIDFELLKGNMDDVFLNVTGKNIVLENGENND